MASDWEEVTCNIGSCEGCRDLPQVQRGAHCRAEEDPRPCSLPGSLTVPRHFSVTVGRLSQHAPHCPAGRGLSRKEQQDTSLTHGPPGNSHAVASTEQERSAMCVVHHREASKPSAASAAPAPHADPCPPGGLPVTPRAGSRGHPRPAAWPWASLRGWGRGTHPAPALLEERPSGPPGLAQCAGSWPRVASLPREMLPRKGRAARPWLGQALGHLPSQAAEAPRPVLPSCLPEGEGRILVQPA